MNVPTELQKVSEETMRFMRGKYVLDEVAGKYYDIDCLKFRQGKKTILSINIHEDRFDFQVIFGKVEREKFEAKRDVFPQKIQDIYDNSKTFHDGKWMMIPVIDLETLEAVKQMITIKKKPNRKPFPKEQAIYSDCGHRCDLCVHYMGGTISEEFRKELKERVRRVYDLKPDEEFPPCNGCSHGGINKGFDCDQRICAKGKSVSRCTDCAEYDCGKASVGLKPAIRAKSISAEDVTWAILPYVHGQYGN
ncbi:MAG TPA: hypothetical protein DDZ89_03865 [Clostridiales bacterium]|nr:hypothetical protein [Clostridiales bacterium]